MPGEDQERFEDYLELERYIEALQEGRVAHPPSDLTPAQARIYRAAALFRAASPDAGTPHPEFVEELRTRLLELDQAEDDEDTLKMPRIKKSEEAVMASLPVEMDAPKREEQEHPGEQVGVVQPVESEAATREEREQDSGQEDTAPPIPVHKNAPRRASFFSRRSLLTGSAVAAASLVVGTGIGAMSERAANTAPASFSSPSTTPTRGGGTPPYTHPGSLVPEGAGRWHFVGTLDEMSGNARRFVTDTIVGYVILSDGDGGEPKGELIAMSAACTHMGCLVQWQESEQQFYCPCHEGIFTEYGKPSAKSPLKYLTALPRMKTMVGDNNEVYVLVPK